MKWRGAICGETKAPDGEETRPPACDVERGQESDTPGVEAHLPRLVGRAHRGDHVAPPSLDERLDDQRPSLSRRANHHHLRKTILGGGCWARHRRLGGRGESERGEGSGESLAAGRRALFSGGGSGAGGDDGGVVVRLTRGGGHDASCATVAPCRDELVAVRAADRRGSGGGGRGDEGGGGNSHASTIPGGDDDESGESVP